MPPDDMDAAEKASEGSSSASMSVQETEVDYRSYLTGKINRLFFAEATPYVLSMLGEGLAYLADYILGYYYYGPEAAAVMSVYFPLFQLVCVLPASSLVSSALSPMNKALISNCTQVADVYLAHTFFLIVCWDVIAPVLFVALGTFIARAFLNISVVPSYVTTYAAVLFIGGPLSQGFSSGLSPLLILENRSFLYCMRGVLTGIMQIFILFLATFSTLVERERDAGALLSYASVEDSNPGQLWMVALASVVANAVTGVWMLLVFSRKQVFNLSYRGCVRFSFKRLFPINTRVLLRILLRGAVPYFTQAQFYICLFLAHILCTYSLTDSSELMYTRISLSNYARYSTICASVLQGFMQGFSTLVAINSTFRCYKRVFKLVMFCLLWCTVIELAVCLVFCVGGKPVISFFQPSFHAAETQEYQNFLDSLPGYFQAALIPPVLLPGFYISIVLSQFCGQWWVQLVLHLTRSGTVVIQLLVLFFCIGDRANFVLSFLVGDSIAAFSGLCALAVYAAQYHELSKNEVPLDPNGTVDEWLRRAIEGEPGGAEQAYEEPPAEGESGGVAAAYGEPGVQNGELAGEAAGDAADEPPPLQYGGEMGGGASWADASAQDWQGSYMSSFHIEDSAIPSTMDMDFMSTDQ